MNTILLEQLSYLAEIVSGIAVVISLIYVGIQIKQNTNAVRSSTLQNITEAQINVHSLLAAHGDLADIVFNAAKGTGSETGMERFRFTSWMHTVVRSLENAYYQYQQGTLDKRNLDALCRQYGPILHAGFNKAYWQERGFMYSDDFRRFIDEELLAIELPADWRVPGA